VLLLAGVSLAGFVVEVAAGDWGGVFLRRDLHASAGLAAAAFAAFSLPHFLVRLAGDPVVDRLPRQRLLAVALTVAALGYVVIVTGHGAATGLVGLALAGAGIALVVPLCFAASGSLAGVRPGSGVATVAGVSYGGWATAPAVIGGLAAGLRVGLLLPMLLAVAAATAVTLRRSV
jgi:MFS family permease